MRYRDYFFGLPVSFIVAESASVQHVAQRLKARVGWWYWPFHFDRVVGRIGEESLSVEWSPGFLALRTNMEPRLSGRLVSANAAVRFDGRIGAPWHVLFQLGFFVCFALFFASLMIRDGLMGVPILLFLLLWVGIPFLLALFAARRVDERRERLVAFVVAVGSGREIL